MTSRGTKYWNSGAIPLIAPEMLGDIIAEIADVGVVISDQGRVLSVMVNRQQPGLRRMERLEGRDMREALTRESVEKFDARLAEFVGSGGRVRPIELNHTDAVARLEYPIRYTFHRIGPDGAILMLGRDLSVVAEMQQQLVEAQIALERDYEVQREYDVRFRVLMETASEAFVFVVPQSGRISEANAAAARLMGRPREELTGTDFAAQFEGRRRDDLMESLKAQALSERSAPVTATLRRGNGNVVIVPTMFRASGERVLLCRIDPEEGLRTAADQLSHNLLGLYQQGPDAIVFTSADGHILSANEGFLNLIEAAHDVNVKGRSLADFFHRGSVDLKVLTDNAARSGAMRLYSTRVVGDYSAPRAAEVACAALRAGESRVFGFVLRDTGRSEGARGVTSPVSDDNVRSVMELVGSATLKEIVAETTNVVERMCIETAVELTMNNRVAAAEMLGLSRQSLYVKLRKYGLLSRGSDDDEA